MDLEALYKLAQREPRLWILVLGLRRVLSSGFCCLMAGFFGIRLTKLMTEHWFLNVRQAMFDMEVVADRKFK